MSKNLLAFAGAAACFFLTGAVFAEPVAVTVDTTRPGATIIATFLVSSPNTSAAVSTRACGWGPIHRFPTRAAFATTWSRRSRPSRCPTCAGRAAASPTNTTGATASGRGQAPGHAESQLGRRHRAQYLRHARVHGLRAADRRRGLSIDQRGFRAPAEAADWLEYLTTPQPTRSAKERAANGHPEPYPISLLGIGNENWGCGGSMTPDEYVNQLKAYARYRATTTPSSNRCSASPWVRTAPTPDTPRR